MGVANFLVYMLFLIIPWTYLDVRYVVRKVSSKGIQRNWNRGKRFSGGEVIRRTSLMNRIPPHNRLPNSKICQTHEIILIKPMFLSQNNSKPRLKGFRTKGKPLAYRRGGQWRHSWK